MIHHQSKKSIEAKLNSSHKRNLSDLTQVYQLSSISRKRSKSIVDLSRPILKNKPNLDEELKLKLIDLLKKSETRNKKLVIMEDFWNEALKRTESKKTLNELKNQILQIIREVSNGNYLLKRAQELEEELQQEKKYSANVTNKLKQLSKENCELLRECKENKIQLQKWIDISRQVSFTKSKTIKYEELLKQCRVRDEKILALQGKIQELMNQEVKLMTIIERQKRIINNNTIFKGNTSVNKEEQKNYSDLSDHSSESEHLQENEEEDTQKKNNRSPIRTFKTTDSFVIEYKRQNNSKIQFDIAED